MIIIGSLVSVSVGQLFPRRRSARAPYGPCPDVQRLPLRLEGEDAGGAPRHGPADRLRVLGVGPCAADAGDRSGLDLRRLRDADRGLGGSRCSTPWWSACSTLPRGQVLRPAGNPHQGGGHLGRGHGHRGGRARCSAGSRRRKDWGTRRDFAELLATISTNPIVILMVVNVVLLLLGMLMEPIPIMLLTVPVFFPALTAIGVDPVAFRRRHDAQPDDRQPDAPRSGCKSCSPRRSAARGSRGSPGRSWRFTLILIGRP